MSLSKDSSAIEAIIARFPHPSFPKQPGQPNYESIESVRKMCCENVISIPCNRGGGQHGWLGMLIDAGLFNLITGWPWNPPVQQPPLPTFAPGATAAEIKQTELQHRYYTDEYNTGQLVDAACRKILLDCFDPQYLKALKHSVTGFNNVTSRTILQYLFAAYGRITSSEITANQNKFMEAYDASQPIATLFDRIEECVNFAQDAGQPYTAPQIINNTRTLIQATGHYKRPIREWKRQYQVANQTWPLFKAHFHEAYMDLIEDDDLTAGAQCSSANLAYTPHAAANVAQSLEQTASNLDNFCSETTAACANLAASMEADKQLITSLTEQIKTLTTTNAKLVLALTQQQGTSTSGGGRASTSGGGQPAGGGRPAVAPLGYTSDNVPITDNDEYCWSHGFQCKEGHNSKTCKKRRTGHIEAATKDNIMGGNTRGRHP